MDNTHIISLPVLLKQDGTKAEIKGELELSTQKCAFKSKSEPDYIYDYNILTDTIDFSVIEIKRLFGTKKFYGVKINSASAESKVFLMTEQQKNNVASAFLKCQEDCKMKDKAEKDRLEKERLEKERLEKIKVEKEKQERLERERLEKIKKEKEEQERLEREAQEKLERERIEKERIEKEKAEKELRDNWASYKISSVNKRALALFLDNPYRVLGLSCLASKDDANVVLDRIKKISRLSKNANIKMKFFLEGFRPLNSDLSLFQKSISELSNVSSKYFWFEEEEYCSKWNQVNKLSTDNVNLKYDDFLSVYLSACLLDPLFEDNKRWETVFDCISYFANAKNTSKIKKHLGDASQGLTNQDVTTMFTNTIIQPIHILADDTEISSLLALYNLMSARKSKLFISVKDEIGSEISQWLERKTNILLDAIKESDDNNHSKVTIKKVVECADDYLKDTGKSLEKIKSDMTKDTVRLDMLLDAYKSTLVKTILCLLSGNENKKVIKYVNEVYPIADIDLKRKLRSIFGADNIKNSEGDISDDEAVAIGYAFHHGDDNHKVDYANALKWYSKAFEHGNSEAANGLGILYQNGLGVAKNEYTAFRYYGYAANMNHPYALYNQALMYLDGEGCVKDTNKGLELLRKAGVAGHPTALDVAQKVISRMIADLEQAKKASEHSHYDLGWQFIEYGQILIVEVKLNFSANVYLLEDDEYDNYVNHEQYSYYGGRATSSPYRVKIPSDGHWHLIVDNGTDGMGGIESEVHIRTLNNNY